MTGYAAVEKEKNMTMIGELREEQTRHEAGSKLQKLLCWAELHIADQFDAISELEDEAKRLIKENESLRVAMRCFSELLGEADKFLQRESFEFGADVFAKDFAPWRNIMAAHGMKQDGTPIARRKKKAA